MKLLLIQPSHFTREGDVFKTRKLIYFGLALPILAAGAPKGWDVEIKYDYFEDITGEEAADLVAISVMTPEAVRAFDIANKFRRRGIPVVLGGFLPTTFPDETAQHCDAMVKGEADYLWPELLADFQRGALKKVYESDRVVDLADVPVPRYDLIKSEGLALPKIRPAQTTRGCPHKCDFCSVHTFFGGRYRHRPVKLILEDLKAAKSHKFFFVDDNIGGNRRHAIKLFKAMRPMRLVWGSQCNFYVGRDKEFLREASRAGCFSLFLGIESINPESLRRFNKGFNKVQEFADTFRTIRETGIEPMVSMIMGLDGDGPDTFAGTLRFLMKNRIPIAYAFILTPCPGTPLFDRFDAEGRIFSKDWNQYGGDQVVFYPEKYSAETLEREFWRLLKKYYSLGSICVRLFTPTRSLKNRLAALKYNLLHRKSLKRGVHPLRG